MLSLEDYSDIERTLPRTQAAYAELTAIGEQHGITFRVADYGGIRDAEITAQLIEWEKESAAEGEPYRVEPFGESKHDYGGAFDADVLTGTIEQLGALAGQAGLVWGGTWEPEPDAPHFELPDSLEQLRAEWAEQQSSSNG